MKFQVCVVSVLVLAGVRGWGQTPLWDNFDDYDDGEQLDLADGEDPADPGWEQWDLGAPPGFVSEEYSYSEPNSLRIDPGTDVVQVFSGVTEGQWVARAMTYYPSTTSGDAYFILLNTYSHGGGKNWSQDVRFNLSGVAAAGGDGIPASGTLPLLTDRWVEVRVEIDLDANTQEIFYDGKLVGTSPWQQSGINELQCIDLYSASASGFFYDDVAVYEKCEIEIQVQPATGIAPLEVTFDASQSECPVGDLTDFEWEFGDGEAGAGPRVTHTYTDPGAYQVRMTAVNEDGVPITETIVVGVGCTSGDLAPWSESAVGTPLPPGCAALEQGCISLTTGSPGITGKEDDLHLVYREVTGDFSMVARIRDIEWAVGDKAGIMARTSLDRDSAFAFCAAWQRSGSISGRIERRDAPGKTASGRTKTIDDWAPPNLWLRLDREGETFTGYWSVDGQNWSEINDRTVSDASETMLLGFTASPDADDSVIRVTFCDVSIPQGPSAGFRRGDGDGDGTVQLTDAVAILDFLFAGGANPKCLEAADADDSGDVQLTDAVRILGYLFSGGEAPPAPGPADCGPDPEGSPELGCEEYTNC